MRMYYQKCGIITASSCPDALYISLSPIIQKKPLQVYDLQGFRF